MKIVGVTRAPGLAHLTTSPLDSSTSQFSPDLFHDTHWGRGAWAEGCRTRSNDIRTLASIPDSNLFVSGSDDGSCMVWNAKDGGEVGKKMVHGGNVYAIVVSRDGKTMASGGNDGGIAVWNLESREKIMAWKAESTLQVWSLAMSQDSHTLASGHNDGTVMLWNTSTGKLIAEPYKLHDRDVDALAFSADDSQIASSSFYSDYTQVTPGHFKEDVIPSFKADDDGVRSLVWLSNGQLISASWDKTIKFWDTSHGSLLMATSRGHTLSVEGLAVTSDGKLLASCSLDQTARLWSVSTHEQIGPALQHPTSLCSVALSSDGHYLAVGGKNNKVYIWNLKDIKELAEIIAAPEKLDDDDTARDDASNGSSWLDFPATRHPDISGDISQVSHYAPEGAFFAHTKEFFVGEDKGKAKAEGTASADELERRRIFDGFKKKIFKPSRAVGKSSRSPADHTQEPVPAPGKLISALTQTAAAPRWSLAQIEQPAGEPATFRDTSSIHSSGAGPSGHPSRPPVWRQSRSSSPALQVTTVAAGRARRMLAGIQPPDLPAQKLPHSVKPDNSKNKPWHKYLLRKQNEHLARRQKLTATSPGSPTRATPPPQHSSLPPVVDPGTVLTSQQGAQHAQPPTPSQPGVHSQRTGRPPSEISLTECDMLCLWLRRSEPRWRR